MRLDLGCGPNKRKPDIIDGKEVSWVGVDARHFPGVDEVCNLVTFKGWKAPPYYDWKYPNGYPTFEAWPWKDDTIEEVHCAHLLEHLEAKFERVHFFNELHRVMKKGAKATIITPHWASTRAYGDPDHKWPAACEFGYFYVLKSWRDANAPHDDCFTCDFDATWGYAMNPALTVRSQEHQQFALSWYKEAAGDLIATLTKRG